MAGAARDWDAIRKRNEARRATIPLQVARPSITRSDALSGPLIAANLGPDRLVTELETMLKAETESFKTIPPNDPRNDTGKWTPIKIMIPDMKTRLAALQMLKDIHGYHYQPQKAQDQDPLVLIINQLPEEAREPVRKAIETTLKARLAPLTAEGHES